MDAMTYERLYEVLRKEKYNQDIQELGEGFFESVVRYLEEKDQLMKNAPEKSAFSKEVENAKRQVENAKKLIKELYERREGKIVQLGLLSSRSGMKKDAALLPEEKRLFGEVLELLNRYRGEVLERVLMVEHPQVRDAPKTIKTERKEGTESANKLVRFVAPTPQFVSPDLKVFGPFEKEEMAYLPDKVAQALVKKDRAEEVKSEKA